MTDSPFCGDSQELLPCLTSFLEFPMTSESIHDDFRNVNSWKTQIAKLGIKCDFSPNFLTLLLLFVLPFEECFDNVALAWTLI